MSPRNRGSTIAEEALARRVQSERERRGWSPAGLASRMTKAGCPMTQSAIWKIENPDRDSGRRRRITFNEAVTFARVFDVPLEDLALSPEVQDAEAAAAAIREIKSHLSVISHSDQRIREALGRLGELSGKRLVAGAILAAIRSQDSPWQEKRRLDVDGRRTTAHRNAHPSRAGDGTEVANWESETRHWLSSLTIHRWALGELSFEELRAAVEKGED